MEKRLSFSAEGDTLCWQSDNLRERSKDIFAIFDNIQNMPIALANTILKVLDSENTSTKYRYLTSTMRTGHKNCYNMGSPLELRLDGY